MKYKFILFLSFILLTVSCERDYLDDNRAPKTIILTRGQKSTNRPRIPERQKIEVIYTGEGLVFNFEISEGLCIVQLREEGTEFVQEYEIDSTALNAFVPVRIYTTCFVYLQTEAAMTYSGTIYTCNE